MAQTTPGNTEVADILERVAGLLELQKQNRYRVRSYRNAAAAIRDSERPIAELLHEQGTDALRKLCGVGPKLAGAIEEIVETGRLILLERLEDAASAEAPFIRVPGVDHDEGARIHEALGIETLEELEVAAHDGSLAQVAGMDEQRVQEIRDALARMLGRSTRRLDRWERAARRQRSEAEPPVEILLELDEEYRTKAEAGQLRTIAPRRFNPQREKWLPIMKTQRGESSFTLLFSNTARAHELGKTRDWVVIYCKQRGQESQCTVITSQVGRLRGRRIIRGREAECRRYYARSS